MARIIDGERQNLIGDNVKKLRRKKGWSQKQLSGKLEEQAVYICRGSLSRMESGERTVSDIEIAGLATVFQVPVGELFAGLEWPGCAKG